MTDLMTEINWLEDERTKFMAEVKTLTAELEQRQAAINEFFTALHLGGGRRRRTEHNNQRLVAAWASLRKFSTITRIVRKVGTK